MIISHSKMMSDMVMASVRGKMALPTSEIGLMGQEKAKVLSLGPMAHDTQDISLKI